MATLFQDFRYSLRGLARNPGFTAAAVLALALGIGSITPTFSLINAFLLRPLPFRDPDRLVHLWGSEQRKGLMKLRVSAPDYLDWKNRNTVFEDIAAFNYTSEDLTGGDRPERISAARVTTNVFDVLGVRPLLGRGFASEEGEPGGPKSVILSQSFWESRFASDRRAIGRTIEVNKEVFTIVGVMPADFVFPLPTTALWLPRTLDEVRDSRNDSFLQVLGRLKPGVSARSASEEMNAIAAQLGVEHPETNADRGVFIEPLRAALNFAHDIIQTMSAILLLANIFVLVIACANVSSLLLGKGLGRSREIAIRAALGASRPKLVRQFLVESLTLAFLGGGLGLVLAFWLVDLATTTIPDDLYRIGELSIDAPALLFTLAVSAFSALLFGILPALTGSRIDLNQALKERSPSPGGTGSRFRLQNLLVAGEVAVALTLLIGTSLMIRSLGELRQVDPGFNPEGVLTLKLILPTASYQSAAARARFHEEVLDRVGKLPGVVSAATVNFLPLNHESSPIGYAIPGQPPPEGRVPTASRLSVSPGYWSTMRIPLLAGRVFDATDRADGASVVVVNRAMAERIAADPAQAVDRQIELEDPSGRSSSQVLGARGSRTARIVGVVETTKHQDLTEGPTPQVYVPVSQAPQRYFRVLARTANNPLQLAPSVTAAVWNVDRNLPITEIRTLREVVSEFLLPQRVISSFLGALSAGAALLAAVGIYGLMAFFVSQRRREMGIRMALGAKPLHVVGLVLRRGLRLTAWGLAIGLVGAFGLSRGLASQLFGVSSTDWLSFIAVPALLALVALLSCYVPARRAAGVDPVRALHED